ncbi:hypothetical protein ABYF34_08740 [Buchananella felis]|uniref:hypothetical protein n=1 Tax=Buchananella felis TaxID=3231492 RepID=UPI003527A364
MVGRRGVLVTDREAVVAEYEFHTIQHAQWDAEPRLLTLQRANPREPAVVLESATDDVERFSSALIDAVEHAIVHSATTKLPAGRWARATVRRRHDGELVVDVVGTALDGADDAAVERLLAKVREVVGMDT